MALTPQELDIAKRVKEQGGSREDFAEVLQEFRTRQGAQPQAPQVPEVQQQEQQRTQEILQEQPDVDPAMAASKARQEQAEGQVTRIAEEQETKPSFLEGRAESLKESADPDALLGFGAGRVMEGIREAGEGVIDLDVSKLFTGPLKTAEGFVESAAGVLEVGLNQLLATGGEFAAKPFLESLDADTLSSVSKTPEALLEGLKNVGESDSVQTAVSKFNELPKNVQKDLEALLWFVGFKGGKGIQTNFKRDFSKFKDSIKKLPGTKAGAAEKLRQSIKLVKDNVDGLTGGSTKIKPGEKIDFGKLVDENFQQLRFAKDFDDLAITVGNIGTRDINILNKSLSGVKGTFKPQGAKEVLNVIKTNLESGIKSGQMPFSKGQLDKVNNLLKKFNTDGLSLSEINGIKKSISEYTKAWTAAGKEAAGVGPEALRSKYSEVMKFIENTASKNGITDVSKLNRNWYISDVFNQALAKQASKAGKKLAIEEGTKPGIFKRGFEKAQEILPFGPGVKTDKSIIGIEKNIEKFLNKIAEGARESSKLSPGPFTPVGGIPKKSFLDSLPKTKNPSLKGKGGFANTNVVQDIFDDIIGMFEAPFKSGKGTVSKSTVGGGRSSISGGGSSLGGRGSTFIDDVGKGGGGVNKANPQDLKEIQRGMDRAKEIAEQTKNIGRPDGLGVIDDIVKPKGISAREIQKMLSELTPKQFTARMKEILQQQVFKEKSKNFVKQALKKIIKTYVASLAGEAVINEDEILNAIINANKNAGKTIMRNTTPRG